MRNPMMFAVTVTGVAACSMTLLAAGTAAADDYVGKTYSDASSAISDAGKKVIIVSRTGDTVSTGDCVVTESESAPWIKGDDFAPVTDTVLLSLNCNAAVATAKTPGNSAASPEGRAALQAAKEAAAKKAAEEAAAKQAADQDMAKH